MEQDQTEPGGPEQESPMEAAETEAAAGVPEAAPTDFKRNVWLLIIILGVVILAWGISVGWKLKDPVDRPDPPPQPAAPQLTAPSRPERQPSFRTRPATVLRVVGGERRCIVASPRRALPSGEVVFRMSRLFDVTETEADLDLSELVRLPGVWADMTPIVSTADLPENSVRPAASIASLHPADRVIVLSIGGQVRAYPVKLFIFCTGVHDTVGDVPVRISWNRLSQACYCLKAEVNGRRFQWRDSGLIYRGNGVLYDEETGSLWDPYAGSAISGALVGTAAQHLPVTIWPWEKWSAEHPEASVLAAIKGFDIDEPPPIGVDLSIAREDDFLEATDIPMATKHFRAESSPLASRTFVLGVRAGDDARAYPLEAIIGTGLESVSDTVGGRTFQVHVTSPRTAYATVGGELVDARVMLWYVWKELNPNTTIYRSPDAGADDTPSQPLTSRRPRRPFPAAQGAAAPLPVRRRVRSAP